MSGIDWHLSQLILQYESCTSYVFTTVHGYSTVRRTPYVCSQHYWQGTKGIKAASVVEALRCKHCESATLRGEPWARNGNERGDFIHFLLFFLGFCKSRSLNSCMNTVAIRNKSYAEWQIIRLIALMQLYHHRIFQMLVTSWQLWSILWFLLRGHPTYSNLWYNLLSSERCCSIDGVVNQQ